MRAVVYQSPNKVNIVDLEKPMAKVGQALVKVKYAGICGTDLHIYRGNHPRGTPGIVLCHEFVGEVVLINSEKGTEFKVGDRITVEPLLFCEKCPPCRQGNYNVCKSLGLYGIDKHGGLAEYITVDIDRMLKLPDTINYKEAALVEPLAVASHVLMRSRVRVGSRVLILGGGPIGYLIALVCQIAGASTVIVSEIDFYRFNKLKEAGIAAINPVQQNLKDYIAQSTKGEGVDIVFEVAGSEKTLKLATDLVNISGQLVIVSIFDKPKPLDLLAVAFKELEIVGSRTYTKKDFVVALDLLAQKKIDVSPLATHIFDLEDSEKAFDLADRGVNVLKVLLEPKTNS